MLLPATGITPTGVKLWLLTVCAVAVYLILEHYYTKCNSREYETSTRAATRRLRFARFFSVDAVSTLLETRTISVLFNRNRRSVPRKSGGPCRPGMH